MYMSASTCTSPVYESNSVAGSSEIGGECRPAAEALVCVEGWDKFLVDTPATQGAGMPVHEILKTATPSYKTNADSLLTPEHFNPSFDDLVCSKCQHVIDRVIASSCDCELLFCAECIFTWPEHNGSCPSCREPLITSQLKPVPKRVAGILAHTLISCEYAANGFRSVLRLAENPKHEQQCLYQEHIDSSLVFRPGTLMPSSTVQDILSVSPSKLCGDVSRNLMSHLVKAQAVGSELEVVTGGPPQLLHRTTHGRVGSDEAVSRTVKCHSTELQVRKTISVGVIGSQAQMANEIRSLDQESRGVLLREAGLTPKRPEEGSALALKSDLHLPWYRL